MNREIIIRILRTLNYKVCNVGQNYKFSKVPYLVLRDAGREGATNRLGGMQIWEVLVYVPDTSIILLDRILDRVEEVLAMSSNLIRANGTRGTEYHDTEINMYMNYIQFTTMHMVRGC